MNKRNLIALLLLIGSGSLINCQSVVNSVHNLSISGTGTIKASSESEVCIFCHTPHNSRPSSPLWNRDDPGVTYVLYNSSTIQAVPGQPDGSSILCLSCHDGTIALGNILSRTSDIGFSGGVTYMPVGKSNFTTDLSDDHPISFLYNSALSVADGQLKDPSSISYPVKLENDKVQCTSCHDPHKNVYNDFLVASTQYSDLCFKCHDRNYWAASSHNSSTKTWNGTGTNPWLHTSYTTVAENGCESCHNPHNTAGRERLMNYLQEENNCLICHNGNVAAKDINAQFAKTYRHNVFGYNLAHDPTEAELSTSLHVECEDCHNPHAARDLPAAAPLVNGFITGVKGINQLGSPVSNVQYEYEVCYRCHADSPNKPASLTVRQISQNNVRLEFDSNNPSYHPVAMAGKNPDCPSLIIPTYTESSIIYCTDCHASNGIDAPAGPHGSIYPSILKYRYEKNDNTTYTVSAYELCFNCHSSSSIMSDVSFGYHQKHIEDKKIPCNICHDPHGINYSQVTPGNSNSHLINFDINVVSALNNGNLKFVDTGVHSGYCLLRCHDKIHTIQMKYPPQ